MARQPQIDQQVSLETSLTIKGRLRSFRCAIKGIAVMVRSQHNAWIHALATFIVCAAGAFFSLSRSEWCWIVLAIVVVWAAEALNTAFEFLADFASPTFHPIAGKAKDVAAGAVLIAALGSAVIGILIIGPHIVALFRR
ncbi:MAG: diacylglycerol kinase [Candidatus Dadabacteria bacterium]